MTMKVVATIEARMASTRLPGKVMLPLAGKPMLERLVERIQACQSVDEIILLTSERPENQIILDLADRINITAFAGSEDDVLDRVLKGTEGSQADVIVQLTGDNPAIDPRLIDQVVAHHILNKSDYTSNYLTQPVLIGQNLRCFNRSALLAADKQCTDLNMRSHGGYFIQTRPDLFSLAEVKVSRDLFRDDIRLTVDEASDYDVMNALFTALASDEKIFSAEEIIAFLDANPSIRAKNAIVQQKTPGEG